MHAHVKHLDNTFMLTERLLEQVWIRFNPHKENLGYSVSDFINDLQLLRLVRQLIQKVIEKERLNSRCLILLKVSLNY